MNTPMTQKNLPLLYVNRDNSDCADAVSFLDEHGIGYRLRDVDADPAARLELDGFGARPRTPTLDWHGETLRGFDVGELAAFLKEQECELEDS